MPNDTESSGITADTALRLSKALDPTHVFTAQLWGDPRAMSAALREVKLTFGADNSVAPNQNLLQAAVREFARTSLVANFTQLKYVCYGVAVPVSSARGVADERRPVAISTSRRRNSS